MLCRICVYECLNENANILDLKLKILIAKYLYIEVTQNDEPTTTIICMNCLQRLKDFDEFFKTVEERQKELHQFANNGGESIHCKLEITESDSNSEISLTRSAAEQLEFSYAACCEEIDELFQDNECKQDVLSLSEQSDYKVSKITTKYITAAKVKKTVGARRKSQRKKSKRSIKTDVGIPKKQAKNILSPEEEKQQDELVAKYISLDCELCQVKSETYKQFQSHYQKVHNQKAYITCCGIKLNKRSRIIDHMQLHKNPEQYKCQLCKKTLKTRRSLSTHNLLYHNRTQLKHNCNICGKKFSYPSMLDKHMSVHENVRNHKCEVCQKSFKSELALQCHIKHMHSERTVHVCDICGKEYRFKLSFEQHIAEHQGVSTNKRKQCHICHVWVAASYFKRHLQRHETVDVSCDVCGQKFTSLPCLTSHKERYHKNLKNYDCPYCDKTFVRPRYLKEHIDVHTGRKEYSCKYCPREFRSKANMYAHRKKMHHALWAQDQLNRTQCPDDKKLVVKNEGDESVTTFA